MVLHTPAAVTQTQAVETRTQAEALLVWLRLRLRSVVLGWLPLRLTSVLLGWLPPPQAGALNHEMRVVGAGTERAEA